MFLCGPPAQQEPPSPLAWKRAGLLLGGELALLWMQARGTLGSEGGRAV